MTTLNNVKQMRLKNKNINDVDVSPITLPVPSKNPSTGEITYNPSIDSLKSDTLLTETSLPVAYSLEGKELDPASPNFKNEILTLSAATELKTKTKSDVLKILEDSEHQKQYQFGDSEPELFGENENKDALSVGIFKNTLTSGIEFSKEHNSEISDNFMTEKVFKDRYITDKLHFSDELRVNTTKVSYNYDHISTYLSINNENITKPIRDVFSTINNGNANYRYVKDYSFGDDNYKVEVNKINDIGSYVVMIFDINNNRPRDLFSIYFDLTNNRVISGPRGNKTTKSISDCQISPNVYFDQSIFKENDTDKYLVKVINNILNDNITVTISSIADETKYCIFKSDILENGWKEYYYSNMYDNQNIQNNIEYEMLWPKYEFVNSEGLETTDLNNKVFTLNSNLKYIVDKQNNITLQNVPENKCLRYSTYTLNQENINYKLLTTEALKDAYVNSLDLKNNEWFDENKDKLVTVEALIDVQTETEKEHLKIMNNSLTGKNEYQFGDSEPVEFDSSETSTKPLTVNTLADTKTTPFEFSKTEVFNNNLMTEKALENTYINDSLKFSKTLTNLDENTEIIDSTTSKLQTIDPEIEHKLMTTDALNEAYVSDKLIFGNTLTTNFVKTEESDEEYVDLIDIKEFSKNDKYNNDRYFDNNDYYIFNNDYHSPAMEQLVNDVENVSFINESNTLYSYIHRTLNNTPDKIEYKIESNNDYIYVYGSLFVNYRYDVSRHILQERIYQSGNYIYNDISISSDNYYYKKSSNEDTYILVYFNFEDSKIKFKYCVSYPSYVNINSNKSFVYSISNVDKTFIPIYDFEFTFIDNELVKIKREILFTSYELATQTITTTGHKNISLIDPEIKHKLVTTDALHDAYVNEIKLLDGMWYDENKHKLITVEASKDLIPNVEHDELRIFPNNEYQFGKNKIEKFNSANTSTNPLSVNVLSNTRTTNFNFDQSQEFKDNLMTEKALKDTYINDTLKFSNTLTTSDLNSQEIEECKSITNYNYNYSFYSEYDYSNIKFNVDTVNDAECDNVNIIVDDTKFNLNLQNNGNEVASIILDSTNKMFRFINPQNNNLICLFTYDIINNKFYTYNNNIYDLSNKIEHTPTLDNNNYYIAYIDEPSYNDWKIKSKANELILYHYDNEIFKLCYSISESNFSKFDYRIRYHTKLFNVDKYFTISKQLLVKSKINVNKITANPLIITEPEYPEYKIMEIINIVYNINENKYRIETNYDVDNKKLKTIDPLIEHKLITTDTLNEAYVPSKILFNENYESILPLVKPASKDDFTKYLVTYYATSSDDTKYYSITSSLESGQNKYYNLNSTGIPEYVYKFEIKNLKNIPPDRCIIFVSTNTPEFVYCNIDGYCSCGQLERPENEIGINEYAGKCWKSTFERPFNILMGTNGILINVGITRDETGILTDVSITENIYHNNISSNIFNEYNAKYDITSPAETHIIGVVNSENVKVEENKLLTTQNLKNAYLTDKLLFSNKLKSAQHSSDKDEKINSNISSKLITTDALTDAYVNSLNLENEEWISQNKYKLLTVESMNNNNFKSFDKSLLFKKDNLTISENVDLSKVNFEIVGKSVKPENLTNAYVSDKLIFSDDLGIPFADGKTHKIINYTVKNISSRYNTCNYYEPNSTEPTYFKLPVHYSTDSDITFKNLSFKVNESNLSIFEVRPYGDNVYEIQYFKENNENKIRLRIDKWSNNLIFDYNLTANECTYKLSNVIQTLTETTQDNKHIYEHEYTLDSLNVKDSFEIENIDNKIIKFSYSVANHKLGEFIMYFEDLNSNSIPFKVFIDYYCYLDLGSGTDSSDTSGNENSKYVEYTETITIIGREIYDSSNHDKYIQNISLDNLHSPDNNLFRFSVNQGIKTYNQNQVEDESLMKDIDYNFEVEHKLLTTDALNDAYVNELKTDNEEWMNENKHKLLTVNALKDFKLENINIDDMILYNKYYCELTNDEAETLTTDLYSTEFTAKLKNNELLIYFDDVLVNKFSDISNYININCSYKNGSVLNSYRVVDKYYGFIFDVYEMNNLFDFNVQIDSDNSKHFENINVIQRFAILRNGEQINERILDKICVLKYCEVGFDDVSLPNKKIYIIKYSNDNTDEYVPKVNNYTIKGSQLIIGDDLLINSGDTLKITNSYESELYNYDENEYSIDVQIDSVMVITFTKI